MLKSPDLFNQVPYSRPECAFKQFGGMIVGGRDASPFEFPHAVSQTHFDFYQFTQSVSNTDY